MKLVALVSVMVPAYAANMAAALAKFWPGWNRPISRRWLGDQPSQWVALGFAQGIGAMFGDAVHRGHPFCLSAVVTFDGR
jgi:hypothetical protein